MGRYKSSHFYRTLMSGAIRALIKKKLKNPKKINNC